MQQDANLCNDTALVDDTRELTLISILDTGERRSLEAQIPNIARHRTLVINCPHIWVVIHAGSGLPKGVDTGSTG
jgi:hypothetical protein